MQDFSSQEAKDQPVHTAKSIWIVLLRALEQSDGVANNFLKNPVELEANLLFDRRNEAKVDEIELSGPQLETDPLGSKNVRASPLLLLIAENAVDRVRGDPQKLF
jgi:hypothetical protein